MRAIEIELVFFDAGGGHRTAMTALSAVLGESYPNWVIRPVNLQQLLLPVDPVFRATRIRSESVYNTALKRGWTRSSRPFLRALQKGIRLNGAMIERELRRHWRQRRPDMVVSLVPNFNGLMYRALAACHPDVPYVTIMTDIADTPPHFWQEPQDQHVICGSDKAELQARLSGFYRPGCVFKVSGMILSPAFYAPPAEPPLTRAGLGLSSERSTAILMFGGNGSVESLAIHDNLIAGRLPVQTIVLCGRNEALRKVLADRPHCHAVGYTDRVADYMRLADVFIGKPGPGSLSEALHMGLPAIVATNASTLVQERYNAIWLEEQGAGVALSDFSTIGAALATLVETGLLARMRARAAAIENRAVYEIADILGGIAAEAGRTPSFPVAAE